MSVNLIVIIILGIFLVGFLLKLIYLIIMGLLMKKQRNKFDKNVSVFDSKMDKKQSMINKYFK